MAEENKIRPPFSPPDCPFRTMNKNSVLPENAVVFGSLDGDLVYIGRVYDAGLYLIGTAIPKKGICTYLSKDLEVKTTSSYEVLTVDCGEPLEFNQIMLSPDMDTTNLFVAGGNHDKVLYAAKVVDGENTYIGWGDLDSRSVYIPRALENGPNKFERDYFILKHKFLHRLCICPSAPV